jgi:hypothetical protein
MTKMTKQDKTVIREYLIKTNRANEEKRIFSDISQMVISVPERD